MGGVVCPKMGVSFTRCRSYPTRLRKMLQGMIVSNLSGSDRVPHLILASSFSAFARIGVARPVMGVSDEG